MLTDELAVKTKIANGLALIARRDHEPGMGRSVGKALSKTLPVLIRTLAVVSTLAMILVPRGIFDHNVHLIPDLVDVIPAVFGVFLFGLSVRVVALIHFSLLMKMIAWKTDMQMSTYNGNHSSIEFRMVDC